ncbi:uncharacterized protein LOC110860567 [Folsomia candida]|uniref:Uncharacterized protein n=1 Tax=Folsomia candida TaxID=158441 RepID=A0A226D4Y8_FOLCA|nr:uncharacterized protein LOC110860567 [Folsomia candida]OXA40612.1 hypothetical protein Fcan01_24741 [Folsomia candida]
MTFSGTPPPPHSTSPPIHPELENVLGLTYSPLKAEGEGWWRLMEGDQIPLSFPSVSISLCLMVIGLLANFGLVIVIIKSLVCWTKVVSRKKKLGLFGNSKKASASKSVYVAMRSEGEQAQPVSETRIQF